MSSTNLRKLGGTKRDEWIESPGSWARVAGALSGCPSGFFLLQHSPLGKQETPPCDARPERLQSLFGAIIYC